MTIPELGLVADDISLSPSDIKSLRTLKQGAGTEAYLNRLQTMRDAIRRDREEKAAAEARIIAIRTKHQAYTFEVKKTIGEAGAEVDMSDFEPVTRQRLHALFAAGKYSEFAVGVAAAREEAARIKATS